MGFKTSISYSNELNAFIDAVFPDFRANKRFADLNDAELRKFILETAIEEIIKKIKK